MNKLVLGALMIGATNIATGCIFVSDDDGGGGGGSGIGDISLAWTTDPGCPPGATTAEAIAIRDDGEEFTDLFDCEAGVGEIQDLAEGTYDVHINITSEDRNTLFAQSFVETGVVVIEDTTVTVDEFLILTEEAFFGFAWELTELGEPAFCDDLPFPNPPDLPDCSVEPDDCPLNSDCDLDSGICRGPAFGVDITATIIGGSEPLFTVLDCEDGEGLTDPLPLADYTVVVDVLVDLDGDGENDGGLVLEPLEITESLEVGNEVVDLGVIELPVE